MHEMAITTNIVDIVLDYARESEALRVESVSLRVGELRDVVDDLMQGCFRHLARGTVAENARLSITRVPLRARCGECRLVFPADVRDAASLICPDCGSRNLTIHSGKEFLIEDIEVVCANQANRQGSEGRAFADARLQPSANEAAGETREP